METQHGLLIVVGGSTADGDKLTSRLIESGFMAMAAPSRAGAIDLLKAKDPALVVLDLEGPDADGLDLLTSMQADPVLDHIPVIILAPARATDAVDRCLAAGAVDFLLAPFSPLLLKAQVRDYLEIGVRRLEERNQREREDLLKFERDVHIGHQIQVGFLPSELPQPEGWQVAARFHPARQVSGDFYDAFMLTQGRRLGLVLADVCDKGVGAALFMAIFRSLIRAFAQQNYSLRWTDVLTDDKLSGLPARNRSIPTTGVAALKNAMEMTNDYIVRNHGQTNMFATTFFGMLDPSTGQLLYINGGHCPPAIIGPNGVRERLKPTGPALGMLPDVEFKIGEVVLEPGDRLFVFSDGVTDARNPQRQLFTEKRMLPLVEQPASSAEALLDRVDVALAAHIGTADQYDDITMLAARRQPESSP